MVDISTNSWKLLYEAGRQALQARKLQEAEQSFSAALQLAEDFAPGDPRLSATLNALARIYSLQRRFLAAAALLNRLLEVTERTLGPNHVQVAGVLTNLAEMYTHLGAAREELDLRERVLAIRADDTTADATSLQRLRERVTELRAMLAAEVAPENDDEEMEPLPMVRTEEYSSPIPSLAQPEPSATESLATLPASSVTTIEHDDEYRLSPATGQQSVARWPGAAATDTTPSGARTIEIEHTATIVDDVRPSLSASGVELISGSATSLPFSGATDHGFSDMGRDELPTPMKRGVGGRSSIVSIAAGVVLVAGILAARSYVGSPEDGRVSQGSVNLANTNAPAVVVLPVAATRASSDPRPAEQLAAERTERTAARASDESPRATWVGENREVIAPRPVRVPSAGDMERTLRGLDGAVKAIDQRAKAAADSLTTIQVQAPTFKKVKIADP